MKTLQWMFFLVGTSDIFTMGQPSKKGSSLSLTVTMNEMNETIDMREKLELKAAKTSILLYNESLVANSQTLEMSIKTKCNCAVKHLEHFSAFLLRYTGIKHMNASDFLAINGIEGAFEDSLITYDIGQETSSGQDSSQMQKSINPNDEYFGGQWALHKQPNKADIGWKKGIKAYKEHPDGGSPKGPKVTVAVLDTGIDYTHPDLRGSMWINKGEIPNNGKDDDDNGYIDDVHGYDFTIDDGDPRPKRSDENHGTHCAGIIGATYNNHIGITGVVGNTNEKVKIMALKIIPCCSSQNGQGISTVSTKYEALNYAVKNGATISSNSYVIKDGALTPEQFKDAKKSFGKFLDKNEDHLYVGAAGNEGRQITRQHQKLYAQVVKPNNLMVGATNIEDKMAPFSNWGKPYVHVMAPGVDIWSLDSNDHTGFLRFDGTSQAAPHVAGLAALIRSMDDDFSASEVKDLIVEHVRKKKQYRNKVTSGGLICFASTIRAAAAKKNRKSKPESCD